MEEGVSRVFNCIKGQVIGLNRRSVQRSEAGRRQRKGGGEQKRKEEDVEGTKRPPSPPLLFLFLAKIRAIMGFYCMNRSGKDGPLSSLGCSLPLL